MTLQDHRSNFGTSRTQIEYDLEMQHSKNTDSILVLQEHKLSMIGKYDTQRTQIKYVLKRVSFGSKDCTKELKLECAYFLGQTS